MTTRTSSTTAAVILYTLLRIALFAVVWALIWFLTPLDALWSAVVAILVSGALSLVLLDRQRGRVGQAAGRFFSRINERIDAAARAEDIDDDLDDGFDLGAKERSASPPPAESDQADSDQADSEPDAR